mgnify:CR=1 FL=1
MQFLLILLLYLWIFEDYPFEAEQFHGKTCALCGAEHVFLDEIIHEEDGSVSYQCNDTSYCLKREMHRGESVNNGI